MNLDRLAELEAAATPGPWEVTGACDDLVYAGANRPVAGCAEPAHREDAAFIAALRNNAKALIEVAQAADVAHMIRCLHPQGVNGCVVIFAADVERYCWNCTAKERLVAALAKLAESWSA